MQLTLNSRNTVQTPLRLPLRCCHASVCAPESLQWQ